MPTFFSTGKILRVAFGFLLAFGLFLVVLFFVFSDDDAPQPQPAPAPVRVLRKFTPGVDEPWLISISREGFPDEKFPLDLTHTDTLFAGQYDCFDKRGVCEMTLSTQPERITTGDAGWLYKFTWQNLRTRGDGWLKIADRSPRFGEGRARLFAGVHFGKKNPIVLKEAEFSLNFDSKRRKEEFAP